MPAPHPRNSVPLTESQKALAGEHYRLPHWYARKMTRDYPDLLEDATDAATLALIRAARDFDASLELKFSHVAGAYIRRSILSCLFNDRGKRRFRAEMERANEEPPIDGKVPDFGPDFDELLQLLNDWPRHRRVVELRYRDGLTLKAIGAVLGVRKQRVDQMLSKAIGLFRRRLKA